MRYTLGLDIGIASCGWAVIHLDERRIEGMGVRIFDIAEDLKTGKSLAASRREARSARRRNRRRKHRIERIKKLIVRYGILSKEELRNLYEIPFEKDIWQIRVEALDRKLTAHELARLLIHLAKRRGFRSNRKSEEADAEQGAIKKSVIQNKEAMKEQGYRTIGEMFLVDQRFSEHKRNKRGEYLSTVSRDDLVDELGMIFSAQQAYDRPFPILNLAEEYMQIWASQRHFSSREDLEKKIGPCTFEPKEKRVPKATFTFQKFRALQAINHLRLTSGSVIQGLNEAERAAVLDLCFSKNKVTYRDIRKKLQLVSQYLFKGLSYPVDQQLSEAENITFIELREYHTLRKALEKAYGKDAFEQYTPDDLDTFGYALTVCKEDNEIRRYLQNHTEYDGKQRKPNLSNKTYPDELIDVLLPLTFRKVGYLSIKALKKIMPYMEVGLTYDAACEKAGYAFQGSGMTQKSKLLPVIEPIANPVVYRALCQARKVINAVVKRYGSPERIHIETARELSKNSEERSDITKAQKANRERNEKAYAMIKEWGVLNPSAFDIVKYKLWEEQQGRCMYSGQYMEPKKILEVGYVDVDHILPYSRSLDDSYNNKVLVLTEENQKKGNQTPYEYLGPQEEAWNAFCARIEANKNIKKPKRKNLLRKNFNEHEQQEFIERNLNDTRYITRYIKNFVEEHLLFRESESKRNVLTLNGKITSHLRSRWGCNKNRKDGDMHHAVDAVIVALTTPSLIQKVTGYYKYREQNKYQAKKEQNMFPLPWPHFREELEARTSENPTERLKKLDMESYKDIDVEQIKPIFVSRMPRRKISGAAHKETVRRSIGKDEKGMEQTVVKKPLVDIKLDKDGHFPMYGMESDPYTYQAIRERLLAFDNNPKKAFVEPLYKPTRSGKQGPLIKSVKLIHRATMVHYLPGSKGVVYNSSIIRTDVFYKNNNYFLIPIYMSDSKKKQLPMRAITAGKGYDDWTLVDETYEFKFSLYPNDVIHIVSKKPIKAITGSEEKVQLESLCGYYQSIHSSTGGLAVISHDNGLRAEGIGSKTLVTFQKYQVDILGNLTKVKKEKREDFASLRCKKSNEVSI